MTTACAASEFTCSDRRCIPQSKRCDGVRDCAAGEDEVACPATACQAMERACTGSTPPCIPEARWCDGNRDCLNGIDEQNCHCKPNEFDCGSGQCVPRSERCNGVVACRTGADEANCVPNLLLIDPGCSALYPKRCQNFNMAVVCTDDRTGAVCFSVDPCEIHLAPGAVTCPRGSDSPGVCKLIRDDCFSRPPACIYHQVGANCYRYYCYSGAMGGFVYTNNYADCRSDPTCPAEQPVRDSFGVCWRCQVGGVFTNNPDLCYNASCVSLGLVTCPAGSANTCADSLAGC
jgi:hypothetical protein